MLNFIEFNDPFSTGNGRARNSTIGFHFTAFNFRRRFDWQDFFPQSVHVLWILNDMNCFHCTDDYAYLSWLLIGILLCFFLLNFAGASIRKIFKMILNQRCWNTGWKRKTNYGGERNDDNNMSNRQRRSKLFMHTYAVELQLMRKKPFQCRYIYYLYIYCFVCFSLHLCFFLFTFMASSIGFVDVVVLLLYLLLIPTLSFYFFFHHIKCRMWCMLRDVPLPTATKRCFLCLAT